MGYRHMKRLGLNGDEENQEAQTKAGEEKGGEGGMGKGLATSLAGEKVTESPALIASPQALQQPRLLPRRHRHRRPRDRP